MATKTKTATKNGPYDPKTATLLAFERAVPEFLANKDSPRDYLERCLDVVAARESELKAFVTLNEKGARQAADESTARYKAGKALSPIDGIPMAIKDVSRPSTCRPKWAVLRTRVGNPRATRPRWRLCAKAAR